jgi:hypothetical protein
MPFGEYAYMGQGTEQAAENSRQIMHEGRIGIAQWLKVTDLIGLTGTIRSLVLYKFPDIEFFRSL